jgi:hypothetical protein
MSAGISGNVIYTELLDYANGGDDYYGRERFVETTAENKINHNEAMQALKMQRFQSILGDQLNQPVSENVNIKSTNTYGTASSDSGSIDFDPSKDLISLHYDNAPDRDDGHSTVAAKTIVDTYDLNVVVVSGTYGTNGSDYDPSSEAVMDATWGEDGWINAHSDTEEAVNEVGQLWLQTIENGGNVYVAEGGQSDFTFAAATYVQEHGGDTSKIHIVQHSNWNENNTSDGVLDQLECMGVKYTKIDDGNSANSTADLNVTGSSSSADYFEEAALNSQWADAWQSAFNYLDPNTDTGNYNTGGRIDFSDTVELLYILGLNEIETVEDFADTFYP